MGLVVLARGECNAVMTEVPCPQKSHFLRGTRRADALIFAAIVVLPLVGMVWDGRAVGPLFRFPPPLEIPFGYLRFSWLAAGGVAAALVGIVGPWLTRASRAEAPTVTVADCSGRRLPWWGGVAMAWTGLWWLVAWTRWPWFAAGQPFTFFPLWLGFIVTVNALAERRAGTCLMRRAPRRWFALFGVSATFWWGFEWLNRFVENWHYLGVADFGPWAYAFNATLCFSTVLPAVAAVAEWLGTHAGWMRFTANGPRWHWLDHPGTAWSLLGGGAAALLCTGSWPHWFYPALWVAPLALILGASILRAEPGVETEVARGDWRRAATWMVAALICGFCWELWNWHSYAKWIYTMPGVERWRIFEMPLLGYAGYLPFGMECLVVAERILGRRSP